jgi:PucR family transcriptional regulator, purine catabolism regulatory protein
MTTMAAERTIASGGMTVADALALEAIRVGSPEVVAGADGLGREIRWAHAGEVRNIASLLRGGELLLTTGIALDHDDRSLSRFAAEIAERGAAALVLELGAAFERVPPALVGAAADHGLPLIVLHREVAFVEVTEAVNQALVHRQLLLTGRLDALASRFTSMVLDGAGIPEVLGALANELRNPVVLQRDDGELLFHAIYRADSGQVLNAWDALRRDLPDAPRSVRVALPAGREAQRGSLVALEIDNPLPEIAAPAMERTAAMVAVITRQTRQEEVLVARERGNLLADLMARESSEAEVARQVGAMGFPRGVPYLLPCVLAGPANVLRETQATVWALAWREIRQALDAHGVPVLGGLMPGENKLAIVAGLSAADQRETRANALAELAAQALKRQFGFEDTPPLYVGEASRSWTSALRSLREVAAASTLRHEGTGWYDATIPDLRRLLWELRDAGELLAFSQRRLAPLVEHDAARRSDLLHTLEVYLDCGGRKTDAARILHLERQSLYHRISRIEGLLGASLDDPDTRLGAHLAVRIRHMLGNGEARS